MAHYLKTKAAVATLSGSIIIIVMLLQTAFFAPVVYTRWQQLSWDDFDGIPPIFSRYAAAISSFIEIEYDSTRSAYFAYAAQHNVGSWVKRDSTDQAYMLRHEQYHFNITEIFARQLNQYIRDNPEGTARLFELRLESLAMDKNQMQKEYDSETDHGTITSIQSKWEFRIDSMLQLERGFVTDLFSGAKAYFPSTPDSSKHIIRQTAARAYSLSQYGMYFGLVSIQGAATKSDFLSNASGILKKQTGVKTSSIDSVGDLRFWVIFDSAGFRNRKLWIKKDLYIYHLHTQYFNQSPDTLGYFEMSESFMNSFSVTNTDSYWLTKLKAATRESTVIKALKKKQLIPDMHYDCFVPQASAAHGFYRGPLYSDDGSMLIAYDFIPHSDSLHSSHMLRLDDDLHITKPLSSPQLYWLPGARVPNAIYNISIGYLLKQDSSKACPPLYQHVLTVTPSSLSLSRKHFGVQ